MCSPPRESLALLRHTVGGDRIDAGLPNAAGIADLAGHLPLAVALVGSRIDRDATWTLADHRERLVEQRTNLVQAGKTGRIEMHDVIRVYAAQRARDEDPPRTRRSALTRLFDYYRQTAWRAMNVYSPAEKGRRPDLSHLRVPSSPILDTLESARVWLEEERPNLMAVGVYCGDHGWPDHLSDLSIILFRYLDSALRQRPLRCRGIRRSPVWQR